MFECLDLRINCWSRTTFQLILQPFLITVDINSYPLLLVAAEEVGTGILSIVKRGVVQ